MAGRRWNKHCTCVGHEFSPLHTLQALPRHMSRVWQICTYVRMYVTMVYIYPIYGYYKQVNLNVYGHGVRACVYVCVQFLPTLVVPVTNTHTHTYNADTSHILTRSHTPHPTYRVIPRTHYAYITDACRVL